MKKGLIIIVFLVFALQVSAQPPADTIAWRWVVLPQYDKIERISDNLLKIKERDSWSVIDLAGKVIPALQMDASYYSWVKLGSNICVNGKYGMIDQDGKMVVEPKFDNKFGFDGGLAAVEIDGRWGYIDQKGDIVIEPQFDDAYSFHNNQNLARVKLGKQYAVINRCGEILLEGSYDRLEIQNNLASYIGGDGKFIYVTAAGKSTLKAGYHYVGEFKNRLAIVGKEGKFGCIDTALRVVLGLKFDEIHDFHCGFAAVRINDKWRVLSASTMDFTSEAQFDQIEDFRYDLTARARIGDRWGIIDTSARFIVPARYSGIGNYSGGFAAVKQDQKWGYVDRYGNIAIEPQFQRSSYFSRGLAPILVDTKWGLIDTTGKFIIKPHYEQLYQFWDSKLIGFSVNNKWGLIDSNERVVIKPRFNWIEPLNYGYAKINKKDLYGLVDSTGKVILEPRYSYIGNFFESGVVRFEVYDSLKKQTTDGLINENGKVIVDGHTFYCPSLYGTPTGGLCVVTESKTGKCGVIDTSGTMVVEPKFEKIYITSQSANLNLIIAEDKHDKSLYGLANQKGQILFDVKYDNIFTISPNRIVMNLKGRFSIIDTTGKRVSPITFDYIGDSDDNLIRFRLNNMWGLLDRQGVIVTKAIYQEITRADELSRSRIKQRGRYGVIELDQGRVLIPPKHHLLNVPSSSDRYSDYIAFKENGKWGYLNPAGEVVIKAIYDECGLFYDDYALVGIEGKLRAIDLKGRYVSNLCDITNLHKLTPNLIKLKTGEKWGVIEILK